MFPSYFRAFRLSAKANSIMIDVVAGFRQVGESFFTYWTTVFRILRALCYVHLKAPPFDHTFTMLALLLILAFTRSVQVRF